MTQPGNRLTRVSIRLGTMKQKLAYSSTCVRERVDQTPLRCFPDKQLPSVPAALTQAGVFSVPSFHGEWFWDDWITAKDPDVVDFVTATQPPSFSYADYAPQLTYELFNATAWAELFAASGAQYVVPTTKHHEGFAMWPSAVNFNWNAMMIGPKRDVYGEIVAAVRARPEGIRVGAYHSLFEWYNPLFLEDQANNFTTRSFVDGKVLPELFDLVESYQPDLIWSDGDWVASDTYWNSTGFLAWLVNESPVKDTVVWNDRWGGDSLCHHGSYYTCADRFLPNTLVSHKWENAFSLDTVSWGYRRNAPLSDYLTTAQVIAQVIQTVALGGNALINIGPARDGTIDPIFADRLTGLGSWLATNGAAIYATTPWRAQNDTAAAVWYTSKPSSVFAIITSWPSGGALALVAPVGVAGTSTATLLGDGSPLAWQPLTAFGAPGVRVQLPSLDFSSPLATAAAWVVELKKFN